MLENTVNELHTVCSESQRKRLPSSKGHSLSVLIRIRSRENVGKATPGSAGTDTMKAGKYRSVETWEIKRGTLWSLILGHRGSLGSKVSAEGERLSDKWPLTMWTYCPNSTRFTSHVTAEHGFFEHRMK